MMELLRAKLELLTVEMETVSLLGLTSVTDSPYHIAAVERQIELRQEISLVYISLGETSPDEIP